MMSMLDHLCLSLCLLSSTRQQDTLEDTYVDYLYTCHQYLPVLAYIVLIEDQVPSSDDQQIDCTVNSQ